MTLELAPAARAWLAEKGYDKKFGARPLARVIQREVKDPIADAVLFGALAKGGRARVDLGDDGKLRFEYEPGSSGGSAPRRGTGERSDPH